MLQRSYKITTKTCKKCNELLPLDCFSKGQGKFKKYNVCKSCDAARRRSDYASLTGEKKEDHAKRQKIREYKRIYNLPHEIAEQLAISREGVCKICNERSLLVVDHCHKTGEVRGFICKYCNSLLGYAKDNIEILQNSISYLNKENFDVQINR